MGKKNKSVKFKNVCVNDPEKIIQLRSMICFDTECECDGCPYRGSRNCSSDLIVDMLRSGYVKVSVKFNK